MFGSSWNDLLSKVDWRFDSKVEWSRRGRKREREKRRPPSASSERRNLFFTQRFLYLFFVLLGLYIYTYSTEDRRCQSVRGRERGEREKASSNPEKSTSSAPQTRSTSFRPVLSLSSSLTTQPHSSWVTSIYQSVSICPLYSSILFSSLSSYFTPFPLAAKTEFEVPFISVSLSFWVPQVRRETIFCLCFTVFPFSFLFFSLSSISV